MQRTSDLITFFTSSTSISNQVWRCPLLKMRRRLFWRHSRRQRGWPPCLLQSSLSLVLFLYPLYKGYEGFLYFSPFYIEVMRVLNVEPTQIFTNNWGFIRDFEKVCKDLKATPIVRVFFSFYTTRLAKGSWVSLDHLSGNAHFTPHSNYKKKMEGKVRPCERARVFSWSVRGWWCPLSWMNDPVEITIYDKKYILISFLTWYKSSVWYPLTL